MPRADCPKTIAPGPYVIPTGFAGAFTGLATTLTAADVGNFNSFKPTGRDLLVIFNNSGSTYTYTIQSASDSQGRTGDFTTLSILTYGIHVFAFNQLQGWLQSDGTIWIKGSNALVLFGVITYPG